MDTRDHGPGELAVARRDAVPGPRDPGRDGHGAGRAGVRRWRTGATPPAAVARGVEEAALALGIAHLLDRPTDELSGGELQRVALGAALAGRPALLVLDEPTSQLDPVAGDELIGSLRRLNEDADAAIVLAEHRLERCLGFADRVIALDRGTSRLRRAARASSWSGRSRRLRSSQTPGARLLAGLGLPPAAGRQGAPGRRCASAGCCRAAAATDAPATADGDTRRTDAVAARAPAALAFDRVWHELRDGPAILRERLADASPPASGSR